MAQPSTDTAAKISRPHLLTIDGLSRSDLVELLRRARRFGAAHARGEQARILDGRGVVTLFFENSTRTRLSFELAAKALGASILDFSAQGSSLAKGESLLDTGRTIDAMGGADFVVVRHSQPGAPLLLTRVMSGSVINAGDGAHAHPTQALLDALSVFEATGRSIDEGLEGFSMAIVGDIAHSRVARSNLAALRLFGAEVRLCGPPTMVPASLAGPGVSVTWNMAEALADVDAVMMLRIQKERMKEPLMGSEADYHRHYGLTEERLAALKAGAFVLHPGPMNRGVEIASFVADAAQSRILDQVKHGVWTRAAIFEWMEEKMAGGVAP
jgi:aspartate carbamoyltransferase catalytic subunit